MVKGTSRRWLDLGSKGEEGGRSHYKHSVYQIHSFIAPISQMRKTGSVRSGTHSQLESSPVAKLGKPALSASAFDTLATCHARGPNQLGWGTGSHKGETTKIPLGDNIICSKVF